MQIGKRVSFYGLLEEGKNPYNGIRIPRIQRDYAQGRIGNELLRSRFLLCLYDSLENKKELVLDFVYGNSDENNNFCPVDGQQRLTTLFLLGLYIGKRAKISENEMKFLSLFSYETRDSSQQFCEKLYGIDSTNWSQIKQWVCEQWWYNNEWQADPTISSMLNVLDEINNHYSNIEIEKLKEYWDWFKQHVVFDMIDMKELRTTDSLYIKMNSRGKPLTDFEHFKAELEGYIRKYNVLPEDEISRKIDTNWTDLLWEYRNKNLDFEFDWDNNSPDYTDNGLDECFYNLFRWYLITEGVKLGLFQINNVTNDIIELAQIVLDDKERCSSIIYRIVKVLDSFYEIWRNNGNLKAGIFDKFIDNEWPQWSSNSRDNKNPGIVKVFLRNGKTNDLFHTLCKNSLTVEERIYIEAFFEKLYSNISDDLFLNRFRIIRNLTENTRLNPENYMGFYKEADEVVKKGFISRKEYNSGGFNQLQQAQETVKINWLAKNPDFSLILKKIENHWLLLGNLNALIVNGEINKKSLCRFGNLFHNDSDYVLIERCLLTLGNYAYKDGEIRAYGGSAWGRWQSILKTFSVQDGTFEIIGEFLNKHYDFSKENLEKVIKSYLKEINYNKEYTWNYYLITYEGMRYCPQSKYRYRGGNYEYEMLGANGGGRTERVWNPYNFTVYSLLRNKGFEVEVSESNGPLILQDGQIAIDIIESSVEILFFDGSKSEITIMQKNGIDMEDRIVKVTDLCLTLISLNRYDRLFELLSTIIK